MVLPKESDAGNPGVSCRKCHSPLRLNFHPLLLRCEHDHLQTLEEALHHDLREGDCERGVIPWSMIRVWEHQARKLHELSGCAYVNGDSLVAADFQEAAHRIEDWMASLSTVMARRAVSDEPPHQ